MPQYPDPFAMLPSPGDVRSCSRWGCPQRVPCPGPDPALLTRLVERAVWATAGDLLTAAERHHAPLPVETAVAHYTQGFWAGVRQLPEGAYLPVVLARFAAQGIRCIETLQAVLLPRFLETERLLGHSLRVTWRLPGGAGTPPVGIPVTIGRLAQHRTTGVLTVYDWRIEDVRAVDGQAYARFQRAGILLGWAQDAYPDTPVRVVEVFLTDGVLREVTRTPEDLRCLRLVLACTAREAVAGCPGRPAGFPMAGSN